MHKPFSKLIVFAKFPKKMVLLLGEALSLSGSCQTRGKEAEQKSTVKEKEMQRRKRIGREEEKNWKRKGKEKEKERERKMKERGKKE